MARRSFPPAVQVNNVRSQSPAAISATAVPASCSVYENGVGEAIARRIGEKNGVAGGKTMEGPEMAAVVVGRDDQIAPAGGALIAAGGQAQTGVAPGAQHRQGQGQGGDLQHADAVLTVHRFRGHFLRRIDRAGGAVRGAFRRRGEFHLLEDLRGGRGGLAAFQQLAAGEKEGCRDQQQPPGAQELIDHSCRRPAGGR